MSLYPIFSICLIFLATQVLSDDPAAGVQNALVKLDTLVHQPCRYDDVGNLINYISYIVSQVQANPSIITKVINERNINTTVDTYGRVLQEPYCLLRTKCAMPFVKNFYGPLMQQLTPILQGAVAPLKGIIQPLLDRWGALLELAILVSGPLGFVGGVGNLATGLLSPTLGGATGILTSALSGNVAGVATNAAGAVAGVGNTVLGIAGNAPGAVIGVAGNTVKGATDILASAASGNVLGVAGGVANAIGNIGGALGNIFG